MCIIESHAYSLHYVFTGDFARKISVFRKKSRLLTTFKIRVFSKKALDTKKILKNNLTKLYTSTIIPTEMLETIMLATLLFEE